MLSEKRQSSKSPTESTQTDSVRTGPTSRLVTRQSERSSISEEDENENENSPEIAHNSIKSSSKSSSPSVSKVKPTTNTTTTAKTINPGTAFIRNVLRQDSPSNRNKSSRQNGNKISTPSSSKHPISILGRVSARDLENEDPIIALNSYYPIGKSKQSIFEKIDTHSGGSTYLGKGTYNQLESCIRDCLSRNPSYTDYTYHTSKHDYYPHRSLTRASVLEDYSYDGVLEPDYHNYNYRKRYSFDDYLDHHHHYSRRSRHYDAGYHTKSAAELSLEEIRQVNDALSKYGVPVFSHYNHPYNQYKPQTVGDIVSACQNLLADPVLQSQRDSTNAVRHVWDNLQHHSPQTYIHGYASPAVQAVASHLFHPNQTPYSPVQSVASHIFNPSYPAQPPAYNPPPPPPPAPAPASSGQGVLARLFGGSQSSSNNPAPPPSSFSNTFNQYPGNNPYTY